MDPRSIVPASLNVLRPHDPKSKIHQHTKTIVSGQTVTFGRAAVVRQPVNSSDDNFRWEISSDVQAYSKVFYSFESGTVEPADTADHQLVARFQALRFRDSLRVPFYASISAAIDAVDAWHLQCPGLSKLRSPYPTIPRGAEYSDPLRIAAQPLGAGRFWLGFVDGEDRPGVEFGIDCRIGQTTGQIFIVTLVSDDFHRKVSTTWKLYGNAFPDKSSIQEVKPGAQKHAYQVRHDPGFLVEIEKMKPSVGMTASMMFHTYVFYYDGTPHSDAIVIGNPIVHGFEASICLDDAGGVRILKEELCPPCEGVLQQLPTWTGNVNLPKRPGSNFVLTAPPDPVAEADERREKHQGRLRLWDRKSMGSPISAKDYIAVGLEGEQDLMRFGNEHRLVSRRRLQTPLQTPDRDSILGGIRELTGAMTAQQVAARFDDR